MQYIPTGDGVCEEHAVNSATVITQKQGVSLMINCLLKNMLNWFQFPSEGLAQVCLAKQRCAKAATKYCHIVCLAKLGQAVMLGLASGTALRKNQDGPFPPGGNLVDGPTWATKFTNGPRGLWPTYVIHFLNWAFLLFSLKKRWYYTSLKEQKRNDCWYCLGGVVRIFA